MRDVIIGIDNGTSGTIGIVSLEDTIQSIPIKSEQNYTKAMQKITRVDFPKLYSILEGYKNKNVLVVLERPMVNPKRFRATTSALRCLEAVLNCVELLGFPRMYCDSKDWQTEMLPKGMVWKGSKKKKDKKKSKINKRSKAVKKEKEDHKKELKKASLDIAKRLFPKVNFQGFKDGDSILMAEHFRRKGF